MTERIAAIRLKIPDNEAFTALAALQRLGVRAERLDRAEIWHLQDRGAVEDFERRVCANESLFNPNKHVFELRSHAVPFDGELWIAPLDACDRPVRVAQVATGRRSIAWRLFARTGEPADAATLRAAAQRLLCNPAIERATFP